MSKILRSLLGPNFFFDQKIIRFTSMLCDFFIDSLKGINLPIKVQSMDGQSSDTVARVLG